MGWEDVLKGPKYNAARREVQELEGKLQNANQIMERAARTENVSRAGQGTKPVSQQRQTQQAITPQADEEPQTPEPQTPEPQTPEPQTPELRITDEEPQTPEQIEEARQKTSRGKVKQMSTQDLLSTARSAAGMDPKTGKKISESKPTKTSEQLLTERRAASKKLGAGKEQPSMIEGQSENKKGTSPSPYQRRRREIVAERPEREARRETGRKQRLAEKEAKDAKRVARRTAEIQTGRERRKEASAESRAAAQTRQTESTRRLKEGQAKTEAASGRFREGQKEYATTRREKGAQARIDAKARSDKGRAAWQERLRAREEPRIAARKEKEIATGRAKEEVVGGRRARDIEGTQRRLAGIDEYEADKTARQKEGKQRLIDMRTETAQSRKDLMGPDSAISRVRAQTAAQKEKPSAVGGYLQQSALRDQEQAAKDKKLDEARIQQRAELAQESKERAARAAKDPYTKPGVRTKPKRSKIIKPPAQKRQQGSAQPMIQQYKNVADKQEEVAGKQEEVVNNLNQTINNQTQQVTKMNNDKYNAKQKGEKNRNLTPFIMPQQERQAPKSGDVPGVVQHPKRRQKKTENKW
jgi:hypothetical protein